MAHHDNEPCFMGWCRWGECPCRCHRSVTMNLKIYITKDGRPEWRWRP